MTVLDRAEYVEQAHLFELLHQRLASDMPMQDLLEQSRFELLATTNLPMAIDYLLTELKHSGVMAPAMYRLAHYFTPFQAFLIGASERDTGRFSIALALQILHGEASYRCDDYTPQGLFFYQFEAICRNRLSYDRGLTAMSGDGAYDAEWAKWILKLRADIGFVDLSDLLFLASDEYRRRLAEANQSVEEKGPFLFGIKEGRIAFGNRRKEPLYLFAAMQRHLGYPVVPRPSPRDDTDELVPQLARRVERLEARIKLLEEERKGGIDITKFYEKGE